ncbi:hypothetical protein BGZ76_005634 [Entomortierella beljakovae]|nr:hypothetical protein BGZ76_005634 [Entomortierella beljakovae]
MGADWYSFGSVTIVGIPIPKEALEYSFKKKGFKILTISYEFEHEEFYGAFICLENSVTTGTSLEVIGPYEIRERLATSKRMNHLDGYLPNKDKAALIKAYTSFVGEKPDSTPGFWMVSSTSSCLSLHSEWVMGSEGRLASEDSDRFSYE